MKTIWGLKKKKRNNCADTADIASKETIWIGTIKQTFANLKQTTRLFFNKTDVFT